MIRVSKQAVKEAYYTQIKATYDELGSVLQYIKPLAYASYNHNKGHYHYAKIYHVDDFICIVEDMAPFGNYKIPRSFSKYAKTMMAQIDDDYDRNEKMALALMEELGTLVRKSKRHRDMLIRQHELTNQNYGHYLYD